MKVWDVCWIVAHMRTEGLLKGQNVSKHSSRKRPKTVIFSDALKRPEKIWFLKEAF